MRTVLILVATLCSSFCAADELTTLSDQELKDRLTKTLSEFKNEDCSDNFPIWFTKCRTLFLDKNELFTEKNMRIQIDAHIKEHPTETKEAARKAIEDIKESGSAL